MGGLLLVVVVQYWPSDLACSWLNACTEVSLNIPAAVRLCLQIYQQEPVASLVLLVLAKSRSTSPNPLLGQSPGPPHPRRLKIGDVKIED